MGQGPDVAAGGDDERIGEVFSNPTDSALNPDQAGVLGEVVLLGVQVEPARLQVVTVKAGQAHQLDAHLVTRIIGPRSLSAPSGGFSTAAAGGMRDAAGTATMGLSAATTRALNAEQTRAPRAGSILMSILAGRRDGDRDHVRRGTFPRYAPSMILAVFFTISSDR